MENLSAEEFPKAKFYIDCGDDDTLLHGNNIIHEIMQSKTLSTSSECATADIPGLIGVLHCLQ